MKWIFISPEQFQKVNLPGCCSKPFICSLCMYILSKTHKIKKNRIWTNTCMYIYIIISIKRLSRLLSESPCMCARITLQQVNTINTLLVSLYVFSFFTFYTPTDVIIERINYLLYRQPRSWYNILLLFTRFIFYHRAFYLCKFYNVIVISIAISHHGPPFYYLHNLSSLFYSAVLMVYDTSAAVYDVSLSAHVRLSLKYCNVPI